VPSAIARLFTVAAASFVIVAVAACGGSKNQTSATRVTALATTTTTTTTTTITTSTTTTSTTTSLPGTGKPAVTIGDKNYTEQFVLGQLYLLALQANGYTVNINRNIGATDVTIQALSTGRIAMYPEYLQTWNTAVAGYTHSFPSTFAAYQAGQRYALAHGLQLLDPTPFSDTFAIGVTVAYAAQNHLRKISDLRSLAQTLTLGGPPEFQQGPGAQLPLVEQVYGVTPAAFKPLAIGDQYSALNDGSIQAADVNTTDGELASGDYALLGDPKNVFGYGNVVPVVSATALANEGQAFADTINRVSALLSTDVIRQLNADVDVAGQNPTTVARVFLETHGVIPPVQP
jgi:osmoprotectant transport system substrate-binding protein